MEKKIDYKEYDFGDERKEGNVSSSNDCTGSVPVPPQSDEEKKAYKNVYKYEPIPFEKEDI